VWVETRQRLHPQYWIAFGLLAAGTAAMGVWWAAKPFLSSVAVDLHIPIVGVVHLSSVLLFDIGVYTLVVGATVLMLIALAHQSLRLYRKPATQAAHEGRLPTQEHNRPGIDTSPCHLRASRLWCVVAA